MTDVADARTRLRWPSLLRDMQMSATAKLVGYTILTHVSRETGRAFPSTGLLARECSLSDRQVRRALRELEENAVLSTTKRVRKSGGWGSNEYEILLERADTQSDRERTESPIVKDTQSDRERTESPGAIGLDGRRSDPSLDRSISDQSKEPTPKAPSVRAARARRIDPRDDERVVALYAFFLWLRKERNPTQQDVTCGKADARLIIDCLDRGYSLTAIASAIAVGVRAPLVDSADRAWSSLSHCLGPKHIDANVSKFPAGWEAAVVDRKIIWPVQPAKKMAKAEPSVRLRELEASQQIGGVQ